MIEEFPVHFSTIAVRGFLILIKQTLTDLFYLHFKKSMAKLIDNTINQGTQGPPFFRHTLSNTFFISINRAFRLIIIGVSYP